MGRGAKPQATAFLGRSWGAHRSEAIMNHEWEVEAGGGSIEPAPYGVRTLETGIWNTDNIKIINCMVNIRY
jgi:hypothetical protein